MTQNREIDSLPPDIQNIIRREVERQVKEALDGTKELPTVDDLPILQTITPAPREVPLSVRLHLRLASTTGPFIGWFIAGFGFLFSFVAVAFMGLDDAIPRNWSDIGKGKITNVETTSTTLNDRRIYAYHFETADLDGAEKIVGVSYGFKGKHEIDNEVPLQKAGKRYRIQGLGLTTVGEWWWFPLVFLGAGALFGVIGLCFPIYSWFVGGRQAYILRYGIATGARFVDMNPTTTRVNKQPVMKVNFEFQVDGERYMASAYALDTSRLTNSKNKVIFYDPMRPDKSVVLDGLPRGIHLDEQTGWFQTNPLRCVLPLLAATVVCGQIVAIVVLAILAI